MLNQYCRANSSDIYDAIIIGGGPSGLACLSALARVRRNVLLIDSGEYRNGVTRHMHDVVGFDGVTPAYFRWAARELISDYPTAHMANGTVTKVEPQSANNTAFTVTLGGNSTLPATLQARKVVLATGLRDIITSTPGVLDNWGQGIYWCPWCDGYEHADQPIGLLGPMHAAAGMAREILTLNRDIVAFVNGTQTETELAAAQNSFPGAAEYLKLNNVTVDNRTIASIERLENALDSPGAPDLATHPEHDLFRVNFNDGPSIERGAFFVEFENEQHSTIGADMGVDLWGGRLAVNASKGLLTNLFGVYAIGDANSDNVTNVYHALVSGKSSAVYIHVQLAREDANAQLVAAGVNITTRDNKLDMRSLWDTMNGQQRDVMYIKDFPHL
ncbi:putative thioredoxin reductase [Microdochium trichocladiopsis]|uniref:Thioredoxin reductase n=1 Tax=Microdochium trichocladiopsis TaxID=1682393 RepID=A0A9P9BX64_9PEZI|nr:putative thioredoxin reductase [Microdochium trichocladiopsis]KAH7035776.1 putative thioredoxin reductase [Microdochium trichocladiopsis]